MSKKGLIKAVGIIGVLGIGLGAFGAHGLKDFLEQHDKTSAWNKAVLYHLIHAATLFALALSNAPFTRKTLSIIAGSWILGILLFSGSLYALSLTQLSLFGPITPLGGLSFIFGWSVLIFAKIKEP